LIFSGKNVGPPAIKGCARSSKFRAPWHDDSQSASWRFAPSRGSNTDWAPLHAPIHRPITTIAHDMRLPLLIVAFSLAAFSVAAGAACSVKSAQLIGAWRAIGGDGVFEEMAFAQTGSKRTFLSWLHQRPEITGATWQLENCRLTIKNGNDLDYLLQVSFDKSGLLELREPGEPKARYKRIAE
jgi:hypothetical protein